MSEQSIHTMNRARRRAFRYAMFRNASGTTFKTIRHEGRVTHSHGTDTADRMERQATQRLRRLRYNDSSAIEVARKRVDD